MAGSPSRSCWHCNGPYPCPRCKTKRKVLRSSGSTIDNPTKSTIPTGPKAMMSSPSTKIAQPSAKPSTKAPKKPKKDTVGTAVAGSSSSSTSQSTLAQPIDLMTFDETDQSLDAKDASDDNVFSHEDELHRHLGLIRGHFHGSGQVEAVMQQQIYSLQTTPLFSSQVKCYVDSSLPAEHGSPLPMYGLLGVRLATYDNNGANTGTLPAVENLVYSNTSAPWSTFICGQQGAGKSHTFSCLLENGLLKGRRLGRNQRPLTSLVFHYDKHAGAHSTQICEAAYLCSRGVRVEVLTSPTNVRAMQVAYNLPDIPDHRQPFVKPLLFNEESLKLDYMLTLMNQTSAKMPLYMSAVTNIIRKMKINDTPFSIRAFEREIDAAEFREDQLQMLNLRMDLLKSFMWSTAMPEQRQLAKQPGIQAAPGHLTIVDLSCSTVNESDVCTLYEICLSMFLASRNNPPTTKVNVDSKGKGQGKSKASEVNEEGASLIIGIDEAHKFLTDTTEAQSFTEELIRVIRQQRHLKARVVIATQEPTLSPQLMDLCDVSIIHRFRSPAWFDAIKTHLAGLTWTGNISSSTGKSVFETIVGLGDGEALVFASNAYLDAPDKSQDLDGNDSNGDDDIHDEDSDSSSVAHNGDRGDGAHLHVDESLPKESGKLTVQQTTNRLSRLERLKTAYIKIQIRQRLSRDGGKSQMAA